MHSPPPLEDVHRLFNEAGDNHYVLNDLYLTDYCCWLQTTAAATVKFDSLARQLAAHCKRIDKQDVRLDLPLLERAAQMAVEEDQLTGGLRAVSLAAPGAGNKQEIVDSDDD